ncbi:uncharacterized protein LOC144709551 [Wolffia australiana]
MDTLDEFQMGNFGMERLNLSHLFLLAMCSGVVNVGDFQPIAMSNSIYLIIFKVLANWLGEVIGGLIRPFQSAFVSRRQSQNSSVVAREIISAWKRNEPKGFIWKVDFANAYDSLDWRFLWSVMRKRGFPEDWVVSVRRYVMSHSFLVLVNDQATEDGSAHKEELDKVAH